MVLINENELTIESNFINTRMESVDNIELITNDISSIHVCNFPMS